MQYTGIKLNQEKVMTHPNLHIIIFSIIFMSVSAYSADNNILIDYSKEIECLENYVNYAPLHKVNDIDRSSLFEMDSFISKHDSIHEALSIWLLKYNKRRGYYRDEEYLLVYSRDISYYKLYFRNSGARLFAGSYTVDLEIGNYITEALSSSSTEDYVSEYYFTNDDLFSTDIEVRCLFYDQSSLEVRFFRGNFIENIDIVNLVAAFQKVLRSELEACTH